MATTLTSKLSLTKPTPGTHEPAAISVLNANFDILDNAVTLTGSQVLTNKTLTSPSMTTATITSGGLAITAGGLTITAGGLTVTAGGVGIGAAPVTQGLLLAAGQTAPSTGANQLGIGAGATQIGNGANTNLQAPAKGTGSGPANLVAVSWIPWAYNGGTVFVPFFQ